MSEKKMILTQMVFVVFIISCISSVPLKPQDKASLQTISIRNHVQMPKEMYYKGPEHQLTAYGLIGQIAADYYEMKNEEKIKYLMNKFEIDVSQIVCEEFTNGLEASGIFNSIVPERGNGEVMLWVHMYGFGYNFESKLKPTMGIEGRLLGPDDSVVWKKYAYVTIFNEVTPSCSIEEFTSNPESLREAFEITASLIVQELVSHMKGKK